MTSVYASCPHALASVATRASAEVILPAVTPAGTRRYELRVRNPAMFLADFRGAPYMQDATLLGETLHLLVTETCSPDALLEMMHAKGENNAEIREIPPSLEDVFVTLTREAERTAGGQDIALAPARTDVPPFRDAPQQPLRMLRPCHHWTLCRSTTA